MSLFILFTRLAPGMDSPAELEDIERRVSSLVQSECDGVEWLHSYATLGDADTVDVFSAPDVETAMHVAAIVRSAGGATAEVWPATELPLRFRAMVRERMARADELPEVMAGP